MSRKDVPRTTDDEILRAALDALPEGVCIAAPDGRMIYMNSAGAAIAGRGVAEGPPEAWAEEYGIYGPDGATPLATDELPLVRALHGQPVQDAVIVVRNKSVQDAHVRISGVTLRAADGSVRGAVVVFRDESDKRRAEEELAHAKNALEQRIEERTRELQRAEALSVRKERLAVLGQLAGGVAHQIRNPLAAIKNAGYVLERILPLAGVKLPPLDSVNVRRSSPIFGDRGDVKLSPEQQVAQSLVVIHEEVRRANDIISGLLDYARIRAPVRQTISTRDLVTPVLESAELPENVFVAGAIGLATVSVDPSQVQEALRVLVRNATDAMPDGGTLTVSDEDDGSAWVTIRVDDTGVGVPADVAQRLFEPLLTTKPMGLGLGLVTARTLVEAQGGQLALVTRPGTGPGASFEMRLPRAG